MEGELQSVKAERDSLAHETAILRAEIEAHEKERQELARLKAKLAEYEEEGLQYAKEAIQTRDKVIDDLAGKLEQALDQLEREKASQNRRHIIFPHTSRA
jgi:uncharacterized protein (DUF3084 family)